MDKVRLDGKTVIVTGSNTGIGKETAKELARRGGRVILACRNQAKGEEAKTEIIRETGSHDVILMNLDLSSLKSVKKFADDFKQNESRLDILVNNAGVWMTERQETEDGFEIEFGTNHLGHFYLTLLLLDKLKASAPSRVVTVSSKLHERSKLNFEDLQYRKGWGAVEAYGRSKTANVLFTVHLAKYLKGTGVTTYSLHPGVIKTELARNYGSCLQTFYECCFGCCLKTPVQGCQTTLYCCLEPSIADQSGLYYSGSKVTTAAAHARDEKLAERLWNISLELVKLEL